MFVKPRKGVKVRDPESKRHLPEEGAEVPENSYWMRRLLDGDVQTADYDAAEPADEVKA